MHKFELALSGGGIFGAAHIGVIEELDKRGLIPAQIAGISAGSIAGAIYISSGIAGLNAFVDEIHATFSGRRVFLASNPRKFYSIMSNILRTYISADFEDLRIPLLIVATDILEIEKKVFDHGPILPALLSSSAYPGIFPPQKIEDHYYVDGCITGNLPADILKSKGSKMIIGSNINPLNKIKSSPTILSRPRLVMRSVDIMQQAATRDQIADCTYCFDLRLDAYPWYQISAIKEIRRIGRQAAQTQIEGLLPILI
jgi:NTE family protein